MTTLLLVLGGLTGSGLAVLYVMSRAMMVKFRDY